MSHALTTIKTILIISLGVLLVLIGIFLIQLIPQRSIASLFKQQPAQQQAKPEYTLPNVTYENDTAKDASYQIALIRPKGFPPAIQQKVDAFYDSAKTQTLLGAQAATTTPQSVTQQPTIYTLASKKPLVTIAGPYVFILASVASTSAEAQGVLNYFEVVYDARTGQEVTLDQFFADQANAYQVIAQAVTPLALDKVALKALGDRDPKSLTEQEKQQIISVVQPGLVPVSENFKYWYLTQDAKLVFVFPPSQIAPAEFGEQVVAVPLETIKAYLSPAIFKTQ